MCMPGGCPDMHLSRYFKNEILTKVSLYRDLTIKYYCTNKFTVELDSEIQCCYHKWKVDGIYANFLKMVLCICFLMKFDIL